VSEDEPEPEPDPEPDAEPDADPAPDLHEPEDLPPEIHETVDRPPMNCDESYNLSRGRGTLTAAVSGRGSDTPYRSTDVVFSWQESTADRPILIMEAKEWCRYGQLKADLMFTCLIRQEDLGSLPLEIRLTGSYIAGQNSCKASYSDRWAVYPPMSAGTSIVFEGYTARSEIRARFGASMAEATNPGNVVTFTDGSFTAIAAQ